MEDFQKRITAAANQTWQTIGADMLRSAQADWLPGGDVAECVMDHIEQYGGDVEAVAEFKNLSLEEKTALLQKAFPLPQYGW